MSMARSQSGTLQRQEREKKEESFLEKIGTLGRKKRSKDEEEADLVEVEGKHAIDYPGSPVHVELSPEDCLLEEGEERTMVSPESKDDPKVKETIKLLLNWVNDELGDERIVVKDIEEDFYDGLVIQKLIERLANIRIEVPEVSQSEERQLEKLQIVLQYCNQILAQPSWQKPKWTAESIHSKNLVSILHLLVAIATHFRAPVRFPEHCSVNVIVVRKQDAQLRIRQFLEEITSTQDELGLRANRDQFDTLFDFAPEKLKDVKKSLIMFANKHLNKINLEVTDLETQFSDGVYLVLLMGLLEGYYVPLYSFHLTPTTFEHKAQNVTFAFNLMADAGLVEPKARPEDIVNQDLKCTVRVLFVIFTKYKHL